MTPKRFLVTGGSQGIGAALVEQARQAGHQVVFTGPRRRRASERSRRETGAHGVRADVGGRDDNARTVEACHDQMGGIDVLINNAGYAYRAEIGALDIDGDARRCSRPTSSAWSTSPTASCR